MSTTPDYSRRISAALAGRRTAPRWVVTGTDPRGEAFTSPPRDRYGAEDFAAECNANGGNVTVRKVSS